MSPAAILADRPAHKAYCAHLDTCKSLCENGSGYCTEGQRLLDDADGESWRLLSSLTPSEKRALRAELLARAA